MKLFYREFGQGEPFLILHGLFGMSDNWLSIGRRLAQYFHVFLLDLRNHGQSPHCDEMNYSNMAEDLFEFITDHKLTKPVVLGHSMGGKVAMQFALSFTEMVSRLIVVDIAPRAYFHSHFKNFLEILLALDLKHFKTRMEIDRFLSKKIPQAAIRQFLLKNLKRNENHQFEWKLNLPAIYRNLDQILAGVSAEKSFSGAALFLKGERSDYIKQKDHAQIKKLFPGAQVRIIQGATHWVHADAPDQLLNKVLNFIQRNGGQNDD